MIGPSDLRRLGDQLKRLMDWVAELVEGGQDTTERVEALELAQAEIDRRLSRLEDERDLRNPTVRKRESRYL